ncbi:TMEM43 family protein [Pararhizobium sp. BT-229]|uniref:TMEM43 family protein n=1 Tax=Pararhizobium sp. BT-229 TaxID=2986923 RepID=UPI0021F6FA0D|nr:TMEM43 family protein [Pararhizobium sp. BT-229]MCV9965021.1 TMEM43 family protein [Pararhizobium sp. BT-229]
MNLKSAILIGGALVVAGIGTYGITEALHTSSSGRIDWVEKNAYEAFPETVWDKVGDLVHLQGHISTDPVVDPDTGLVFDALVVSRDIQIYQWVEDYDDEPYTDRNGDKRTRRVYSYARRWVSKPVRSTNFHDPRYVNRGELPFRDATFRSNDVDLDGVPLSVEVVDMTVSELGRQRLDAEAVDLSSLSSRWSGVLRPERGYLATARDPNIGDIRVSYSAVLPARVSVVAQYAEGVLRPYATGAGSEIAGNGFSDVARGDKSLSEMLGASRSRSGVWAWVFRVLAAAMVAGGVALLWLNRPRKIATTGAAA